MVVLDSVNDLRQVVAHLSKRLSCHATIVAPCGGVVYGVSSLPGGPDASSPLGPRGGVFTVERSTGSVQQVATGLDGATDLAVTPQGDVFVTELFGRRVSKVSAGGSVELVAELDQPVAIEYFRGTLYVARGRCCGLRCQLAWRQRTA